MKAKLKSANGFMRFMLAHGEKLGMGAVVVVALLLIWSSLGRASLDENQAPSALEAAASAADANIQRMTWDSLPPDEATRSDQFAVTIDPDAPVVDPDYDWQGDALDPPVTNSAKKRTDPELLALEKLELSAGSGLVATADPQELKRRMLAAIREQQEREREEEQEREREEEDDRGGRRRGRGDDGGGYGGGDGQTTKDGALVVRPSGGAPLEGGEDVRNRSWVIVKAKVPIRAQFKAYEEALATARGYSPQTDVPVYQGYQVERAEVNEAGEGEWQKLPNIVPKTLARAMETWPIQTPDEGLIDPRTKHPLLTYPLPPIVLRAWDSSVTHSELPPPSEEELMGGDGGRGRRGRGNRDDDDDEPEAEGDALFEEAGSRAAQPGRGGDGGYGRGDGGGGPNFGGPAGMYGRGDGGGRSMDGGGRYAGRGDGGRGDGGGIPMGMRGGGENSVDLAQFMSYQWDNETRYLLFRYFDMSVQPGKRYKYRVRLVVKDVNDGVQEMYLDDSVSARRAKEAVTFRFTDWSEPSPVAVVPQAGLVYVAGAKPANPANFGSEPEAELLIKSLDARAVAEVALAENFMRGSVLNLIGQQAKIIWSNSFEAVDDDGEPVQSPPFDFSTGLTLLDFDGGEVLAGNRELTAPARAILMDAAGRLWIKRELDDLAPVGEYDAYLEEAKENARRQVESGRGGRDAGRGGGRGGGGRGGRGGD